MRLSAKQKRRNPTNFSGGRIFSTVSRIVFFLLTFSQLSCAQKGQKGLETRILSVETGKGTVSVEAEIADTDEKRAQGLMYRREIPDGKGMLFVFDSDKVQSFWMKNTLVPLSIAFISFDGVILEIRDMEPNDLSSVHSSRSVRYALELGRGGFARAGISVGDRIISGL